MPVPPITRLGRYEIRSLLGAGGMGEVYLAEDTQLPRKVAVKLLPADLSADRDSLMRFEREAYAASSLNHPNILTIYEIGEEHGHRFIATEYVEGESLGKHMRAPMELKEILDVASQVASALAAAHQAGIVHRDIKPENIMLTRDGLVKVLDFGIAKLTDSQTPVNRGAATTPMVTEPGAVIGTVSYMSPEQARGIEVDARTDIWSLGVVLYEMVAGRLPFEGTMVNEVIALILRKEPPTLARYAPDVPPELERIVTKALKKDKDERYQVVKQLALDLKSLKQRLEFEAERERTGTAERSSEGTQVAPIDALRTTSNAEYIVGEVKRHKRGAMLIVATLVAVIVAAAYFAYSRYFAGSGEEGIRTIAVLPFVNTSKDPETEYLSDGITDSLINSLSQLPGVKVIARSSSFKYKGKEIDQQEVAKTLGVRAIVTGRVTQRGDSLQVSVEMVDMNDKRQIWGEQYNRKAAIDLLAVQQEIAQEISRNLRLKLSSVEQSRVGNPHTANGEAYELYLKGRFYWNRRTGESLKKSVDYFNQAIEKDPTYALAYVGLADAYVVIPYLSVGSAQDCSLKAKAAARRALEIDDSLAEGHTALAAALMNYDWNLPASNIEFERAIELNPNYATAHHWYGHQNLTIMGQFDRALAEMRRAQELDPLSLIINANYGNAYFNARRYDEAIQQLRKTIEIDQSFFVAHHYLGSAYAMKGDYSEALAEYEKAHQLNEYDPHVIALTGRLYAVTGKRTEALKTLAQLKSIAAQRYVADYSIALVYAGLGERDQAFALLEKSYRDHTVDMPALYYDPLIDNLRSDPRFADLLRRVGLPQ